MAVHSDSVLAQKMVCPLPEAYDLTEPLIKIIIKTPPDCRRLFHSVVKVDCYNTVANSLKAYLY